MRQPLPSPSENLSKWRGKLLSSSHRTAISVRRPARTPFTHPTGAMLEVEIKYVCTNLEDLEQRLIALGVGPAVTRTDVDHYFNAPDRDFATTDEALRLRRIGTRNFVTYKGPKRDATTKTRVEVEVPLADGDQVAEDFTRLLTHLGYRSVAVVRKARRLFHLDRARFSLEVTLDDVEGVGHYAEVEIQAPEAQVEDAQRVLRELASQLGLTQDERRSYLELLLARRGG